MPSAPSSNARPWASCRHLSVGNRTKFLRRRLLCLIGAAVGGLFVLPLAWAQDYPTRAVTIIVPFTPGGSTDIIARMLAQKLEQRFGKSFVVENRPGAGTIIAASEGEGKGATFLVELPLMDSVAPPQRSHER